MKEKFKKLSKKSWLALLLAITTIVSLFSGWLWFEKNSVNELDALVLGERKQFGFDGSYLNYAGVTGNDGIVDFINISDIRNLETGARAYCIDRHLASPGANDTYIYDGQTNPDLNLGQWAAYVLSQPLKIDLSSDREFYVRSMALHMLTATYAGNGSLVDWWVYADHGETILVQHAIALASAARNTTVREFVTENGNFTYKGTSRDGSDMFEPNNVGENISVDFDGETLEYTVPDTKVEVKAITYPANRVGANVDINITGSQNLDFEKINGGWLATGVGFSWGIDPIFSKLYIVGDDGNQIPGAYIKSGGSNLTSIPDGATKIEGDVFVPDSYTGKTVKLGILANNGVISYAIYRPTIAGNQDIATYDESGFLYDHANEEISGTLSLPELGQITLTKVGETNSVLLANAKFQLKLDGKNVGGVMTTDANGKIVFTGLEQNKRYEIVEVEAPTGYQLLGESTFVDLNGPNANVTISNKLNKGQITLTKVGELDKPLQFAEFQLKLDGVNVGGVRTTDANGKIVFTGLDQNKRYELVEVKAPTGYELLEESTFVTLNGPQANVTIKNERTMRAFRILKTDSVSGEPVAGATIGIFTLDNVEVARVVSTNRPVAIEIPTGEYYAMELVAPEGYLLDQTKFPFEVLEDELVTAEVSIPNVKAVGEIEVTKTSSLTNTFLDGVVLGVFTNDNTEIQRKTVNGGVVKFSNLPLGEYYVKEISTVPNYILNTNKFPVSLTTHGQVSKVTIVNNPSRGIVDVNKTEGVNGEFLAGSTIGIFKKDNTEVERIVTADGTIRFDNLLMGEYYVKEIIAPEGYVLNDTKYPVTLTANGQRETVDIVNEPIRGRIDVDKLSTLTGTFLEGAVIGLFSADDKEIKRVTSTGGTVSFGEILYGEYYVKEISAPVGYVLNTEKYPVNIRTNGQRDKVTISNEPIRGFVDVDKMSALTVDFLEGAVIGLFKEDGTEVARLTSTGATDVFEDVLFGNWYVQEISAPVGYVLNTEKYYVNITTDGQREDVEIVNEPIRADHKINKSDLLDGRPIEGVEFGAYLEETDELVATGTTDVNGYVLFEDLLYGDYYFKEIKTPVEYVPSDEEYGFVIREHGKLYGMGIKNQPVLADVLIKKKDLELGFPIEKAEFGIFDAEGVELDRAFTDANGEILFEDLRYGDYVVRELNPRVGYLENEIVINVQVREHNAVYEYEVLNEVIRGHVHVVKIDGNNEEVPLEGAEFTLTVVDVYGLEPGTVVDVITSNEDGFAYYNDIRYGIYKMTETKAPEGFYPNGKEYVVEITEHGKTYVHFVVNFEPQFRLKLYKTDGKDIMPITGVPFQLYKDGELLEFTYQVNSEVVTESTFITNDNGILIFPEELGSGNYQLVEVEANEGYLNIAPIDFVIDEDTEFTQDELGFLVELDIQNDRINGGSGLTKTSTNTGEPLENVEFELWMTNIRPGVNPEEVKEENHFDTFFDKLLEALGLGGKPDLEDKLQEITYVNNGVNDFRDRVVSENLQEEKDIVLSSSLDEDGYGYSSARIGRYATNANGEIFVEDLDYGVYYWVETKTVEGYVMSEEIHWFEVSEHGTIIEIEVENRMIEAEFELTKSDVSTGELLPDTGLRIIAEDGETILEDKRTDENGVALFGPLVYGKYFFQEYDAPEGYVIDESLFPFEIKEDGVIVKAEMTNRMITSDLLFTKTDVSTGELLPDTGVRIYDENKEVVVDGRTDENGVIYFEELTYGKYYFQEYDAPEGYVIDESLFPFEVREDGEIIKANMTNKMITSDIVINKTDVTTSEPLPDTGIRIVLEDGETILFEGRTDENGDVWFKELTYGKYFFQEYDAPEGYVIDESLFPFEVKEDGEIIKASMTNEKEKGEFELTKFSYEDESLKLEGVRFGIYNEDKELIEEVVTGESGTFLIELEVGNYYYQELEALEGYTLDDTMYAFEVKYNEITRDSLGNSMIPKTGVIDFKGMTPIVIGLILSFGGVLFFVYKKRTI